MNLLDGTVQVGTCFIMYIHHHGTSLGSLLDVFFRMCYHEMHIKRFLANLGYGFKNRKTKRDIGNEYPIHDVHVEPVGFTLIDHFNFASQIQEIGWKQRWWYQCLHILSSLVKTVHLVLTIPLDRSIGVCYLFDNADRPFGWSHFFGSKNLFHRRYCYDS